jgi:ABC-2 type transport system permease protein
MSQSIVGRMIVKDLFLARWLVIGALVLSAGTLALMPLGPISFYVGTVSYICVLIILNIMIVMSIVAQEKKDKVLLFVLSLPISTGQYMIAKMTASLIAFVVPFLVTGAGVFVLFDATPLPNGFLPFASTVMGYILAYFFVFLTVALIADSGFWNAIVIVVGNISTNFFIPYAIRLPSVVANSRTETVAWSSDVLLILAVELGVCAVALGLAIHLSLRKKDFI